MRNRRGGNPSFSGVPPEPGGASLGVSLNGFPWDGRERGGGPVAAKWPVLYARMPQHATHLRDLVDYEEAAAAQRRLVELRREGKLPDLLWLLEHPPTITWGSAGGRDHFVHAEEELRGRGVAVVASERGGDVTYHGPGQLVGYPIV